MADLKIDMADIEFIQGMGSINLSNHEEDDHSPYISITTPVALDGDMQDVKRQLYRNAIDMLAQAQEVLKKELDE
ncbi:MAG: hypothetical protein N4A65_10740 [Cohaesibacter sp.]|jgi:hypothetical protein|nr:hypothetical protein [Cohaesibacter sp.]